MTVLITKKPPLGLAQRRLYALHPRGDVSPRLIPIYPRRVNNRLAWLASRCRLRFLIDRRRRFTTAPAGLCRLPRSASFRTR